MHDTRDMNGRTMTAMMPEEKLAWLRLARSPGLGPVHISRLVERFGSARAAVDALPGLLATGRWGEAKLAPRETIERELEAATRLGAHLLVRDEPCYPAALRAIDDAPVAIVVRGRVDLLPVTGVAVVGSRNASANGRVIALEMARGLAGAGLNVVSGLARGIDTAAHRGALEVAGATAAVVAGGVDVAYPEENAALMEEIARQGAIVSERPLGAVPRARDFPRRNRIIAGLSMGVVIVEAAPQSGSLITARLGLEQGREVMAVPGSPLDPRHRGTNRLLREGAALVENAGDVLDQLAACRPAVRCTRQPAPLAADPQARVNGPRALSPTVPPGYPPALGASRDARGTQSIEHRLRRCLGADPVLVDELVRQCEASVTVIQAALLDLELDGRLERHPGNRVSLRPG
jgi:DNA processing protein